MEPMILSVTFAAGDPADGGAVAILIKWSDKREERLKQTDNLEVYTASAKHRASLAGGSLPTTNSAPWADWFVKYADAYDDANGGPPSGYVGPVKSEPVAQANLFGSTPPQGVQPITDPRQLRRLELESMEPKGYKALAKVAGVTAIHMRKKAELIDAILVHEFDRPKDAPTKAEETPVAQAAPVVKEEAPPKAKRGRPSKAEAAVKVAAQAKAAAEAQEVEPAPTQAAPVDAAPRDPRIDPRAGDRIAQEQYETEVLSVLPSKDTGWAVRVQEYKHGAKHNGPYAIGILGWWSFGYGVAATPELSAVTLERQSSERVMVWPAGRSAATVAEVAAILELRIEEPQAAPVPEPEAGIELGGGFDGAGELGGGLGSIEFGSEPATPEPIAEPQPEPTPAPEATKPAKAPRARKPRAETPPPASSGPVPVRPGAGCKQPDQVQGWSPGRVLTTTKKHKGGPLGHCGTCVYSVRCEADGGYTLIGLEGNRKVTDPGKLHEGKRWPFASPMLTDLMGIPRDSEGRPKAHHRMTITRWFALE